MHENVTLLRRWFHEVWNERRPETIDELLAPQSVCHSDGGVLNGRDEFKALMYEPFVSALPDLCIEIDAIVADGDQVVVRWHAMGTHTGEGLGIPATGRTGAFCGITWVRVEEGKLVEGWQCSNIPEVLRGFAAQLPKSP
jgi:steroid delta-isomerase-like uncharacterized protein